MRIANSIGICNKFDQMKGSKRHKKMVALLTQDTSDSSREFNLIFWSQVDDEVKFSAAWDLVKLAWETKGRNPSELRFNRSIAVLKRE